MGSGKRVALTIQQRLDVLEDLKTSSISRVAKKYNVHYTTIHRIKENAAAISEFANKNKRGKCRQRMKKPMYEELEEKLLLWFLERRLIGDILSDALLLKKAAELKDETGVSSHFRISRGWLSKFKVRHGIRLVRKDCESASAEEKRARKFVQEFQNLLQVNNINLENVYNMDESGLLWEALPVRTFVGKTQNCGNGYKIRDERLTIGLCANATGKHKVMPIVIYKHKQPRALKDCMDQLPVVFKGQLNARMNQILFVDWFENYFKESVRQYQLKQGLRGKVILLLSNCTSHKFPTKYTHDEHFEVVYLPPDITSLIQPMDQGIIERMKRNFRYYLTQRLVAYGYGVQEFYKKYNIKDCIEMIGEAWDHITCNNIKNAWKKIMKFKETNEEEEEQKEEHFTVEMQQIWTRILEHNITPEDIEQYLRECHQKEKQYLGEIEDPDERRNELRDIEREEETNEERDDESEEETNEERGNEREEEINEEGDDAFMEEKHIVLLERGIAEERDDSFTEEKHIVLQERGIAVTPEERDDSFTEEKHIVLQERGIAVTPEERDDSFTEEKHIVLQERGIAVTTEERDGSFTEEKHEILQQRGIAVTTEEREELEDIFKCLERYKNRISRSDQLHLEGIKLLFLGDVSRQ